MESLNIQVLIVCIPSKIKQYTVSHLTSLASGIKHARGHGYGSTLKLLHKYQLTRNVCP